MFPTADLSDLSIGFTNNLVQIKGLGDMSQNMIKAKHVDLI